MRFRHHLFVCENVRDPSDPRGCCTARGGAAVREALKRELKARGLQGAARANAAGCLDACEHGPVIAVYPEGVWYGKVRPEDVAEIVESHLLRGVPVERLRLRELEAGEAQPDPTTRSPRA
jgi:(2Fe-2S) ferredoxin